MSRPTYCALMLIGSLTTTAWSATINVPADFALIQDAITAATDGDEIVIAPGNYNQRFNFAGKAVTVRSQNVFDPTLTTINGTAGGTVVTFASGEGSDSKLIGLTLTNGMANNGGGVLIAAASPMIENCHIQNCQAQAGGGIAVIGGSPTLRRCWFIGNDANIFGGGMHAGPGSAPVLDGCRFEGNDSPTGSASNIEQAATLVNTEVFDNVNGIAVTILGNSPVIMVNCVVTAHALQGIALNAAATNTLTIANCIVTNNAGQIIGPPARLNVRFSNVQGGFPGPGNINANPLFLNPAIDDFRLQANSPCIDAGENAMVPVGIVEDFRGVERFTNKPAAPDTGAGTAPIVDLGAHEFPPPRRYVNVNATGFNHGGSWSHAFTDLQDAPADARVVSNEISEVFVAVGTYHPDRGTGDRTLSFEMVNGVKIIGGFVGGETDETQADPRTNQTVLGGAIGAAGDSDNSYHVVKALNVSASAQLVGFIVQKGHADVVGQLDGLGGGIIIDQGAPIIRDCWIRQNFATSGGGVAMQGNTSAQLLNSRICINDSDLEGGGLAVLGGAPRVTNCYFSGNVSQNTGGAIRISAGASATLTNNTILGNTSATAVAGGVSVAGTVTASNNILKDNIGSSGTTESQQFRYTGAGSGSIGYSNVAGWTGALGGVNNSATDPQLVDADGIDDLPGTADDNPRLSNTSPCIDAGDADALPVTTLSTDADGQERFVDINDVADTGVGLLTYLDRGAYELQALPCPADIAPAGSPNASVDIDDLLLIINNWGQPGGTADVTANGIVDIDDLLLIVNAWGSCP